MLRLRDVVAGYGAGDILKGVDLDVGRGSVACIVGPNGAGKSTVLRVVSGLLRARAGSVEFDGRDIRPLSPSKVLAEGVAHVPQSNGVFPTMTVRENVLLGAYLIRKNRALVAKRHETVKEHFPIVAERADDKAGNLSGGQRRMLEFARTLMLDPQLILLDEPSAGLDPIAVEHVSESIKTMTGAGKTLLIVEQNVRFGLRHATDGLIMDSGSVVFHAAAAELLEKPEIAQLLFGGGRSMSESESAASA